MSSPLASIIILNFNGEQFLGECLEAALAQTYRNFEVIVVDNGSTDGSVKLVRDKFPTVRLLALGKNMGFSAGNNRGMEIARGEYIALLNNDAAPEPRWLEELCRATMGNAKVGICASRMMFHGTNLINEAGQNWAAWGHSRIIGYGEECREEYLRPREVFGACAGAALYRRSMLDEIGMFDEDFFAYAEDVDLSFRAQLADYRCVYVPTAVVGHYCGRYWSRHIPARVYYAMRNSESAFVKNMPLPLVLKYVWRHLFYLLALNTVCLLRGRGVPAVRADLAVVAALPRLLRKRRQIQRQRKTSIERLESLFDRETLSDLVRRQWARWRKRREGWNGGPEAATIPPSGPAWD
jgi:GT2 family glycosyltransferase